MAGGKAFIAAWAFVDIGFIAGGVRKDPSKGVAFAQTAYLFQRAWKSSKVEASGCSGVIRVWKNEGISWTFFFCFCVFQKLPRFWQVIFASRVAAEAPSSSSSRPPFMYVKSPTPGQTSGWSNIAFSHILRPQ